MNISITELKTAFGRIGNRAMVTKTAGWKVIRRGNEKGVIFISDNMLDKSASGLLERDPTRKNATTNPINTL